MATDKTATPIQIANARAVRNAVVSLFLETGKAVSADEIATRLSWSASKTRRVINQENSGAVAGTQYSDDRRPSYEKSYGQQSSYHKVGTYQPSRSFFRRLVLEMAKTQGSVDAALERLELDNG